MKKLLSIGIITTFVLLSGCSKKVDYENFVKAERQINDKQLEIFERSKEVSNDLREVMKRYPDKKLKLDSSLGLSQDQEDILMSLVKTEKDATFKGVLQQVVDKNNAIRDLNKKIQELENKLPTNYTVKKGDTHRSIAIDFLKNVHKLDDKQAKKLVETSSLVDEMEVGYKIWLYYNDGVFGTFVTQGTAKIGPYRLKRMVQQAKQEDVYKEAYQKGYEDGLKAQVSK